MVVLLLVLFTAASGKAQENTWTLDDGTLLTVSGSGNMQGINDGNGHVVVPKIYKQIHVLYQRNTAGGDKQAFLFLGIKAGEAQRLLYPASHLSNDSEFPDSFSFSYTIFKTMRADLYTVKGELVLRNLNDLEAVYSNTGDSVQHYFLEQGYLSLTKPVEDGSLHAELEFDVPVQGKPLLLTAEEEQDGKTIERRYFFDPATGLLHAGYLQDFMEIDQGIFLVNNSGKYGIYRQGKGYLLNPEYSALHFETNEKGELVFPLVAKQDEFFGVLSAPGTWLIEPEYHNIIHLRDQGFLVEKGKKWEIKKRTDTLFLHNEMDMMDHSEVVVRTDSVLLKGLSGFYSLTGKKIIPPVYNRITLTGKFLIAEKGTDLALQSSELAGYEYPLSPYGMYYDDYLFRHPILSEKCHLYSKEKGLLQKNIEEWEGDNETELSGEADSSPLLIVRKKNKWGLLGSGGKWILPPEFKGIKKIKTGNPITEEAFYIVENEKGYGVYASTGDEILPLSFSSIEAHLFSTDSLHNNEITFVATLGGKMQHTETELFNLEGFAETISEKKLLGAKYVLYDREGKRRNARAFDTLSGFHSDAYFMFALSGLQGLIHLNGEIVIPPEFLHIRFLGNHYFEAERESYSALYRGNAQLIAGTYSGFDWINDKFFRVRSGTKYGLYSIPEKKLVLPVEYDFLYTSGDYFIVGREMKQGYADSAGHLILPAVYDDIEVEPQGFSSHVMRVTEKGKCGYFDKHKKIFLTQPTFDISSNYAEQDGLYRVNSGGEAVMNANGDVVSIKGGKWGMVNYNGEVVLPAEFESISPFAVDAKLFRCVKQGHEYFYNSEGREVNDGKRQWEQSLSGKWMKLRTRDEMQVIRSGGPVGADATAFHIDRNGNYWLGTGSSGGVYFSSDKGHSWQEKNEGIGPAHVYLLLERNDTLYALVTASEERFDDYSSVQVTQVFSYHSHAASWIPVFPPDEDAMGKNIVLSVDLLTEKRMRDSSGTLAKTMLWQSESQRFSEDNDAFNYYNIQHYDALLDVRDDRLDTIRNKWPFDMLHNGGGNHFADGEELILLAKSGLYRMHRNDSIAPVSEKGLVASDITQTLVLPDATILLREGEQDIWKYDGKTYTRIIDNYAFNLNRKQVPYTRNTRNMFAARSGNTYVVVADQLIRISPEGKQKILFTSGALRDVANEFYDYPSYQLQIMEAAEDAKGQIWCLAQLVKDSRFEDGIYVLAQLDEKNGKLNIERKNFIYPEFTTAFLFPTPDYRFYLCYDQWLIDPLPGDTIELPYSDSPWFFYSKNAMAIHKNGDVAVQTDHRTLLLYSKSSALWQQYNYEGLLLQTFGFDREGHLYAASSNRYMFYCDGFADLLSEAALYRFYAGDNGAEWEKIPNGINPKILHINAHPEGGLLLGSSGSGLLFLKKR